MFKIFDKLNQFDTVKTVIVAVFFGLIIIASPIYGLPMAIAVYFLNKSFVKIRISAGIILTTIIISLIAFWKQEEVFPTLPEFIDNFNLNYYLFALYPFRVVAAGAAGLITLFGEKTMKNTVADVQLEEAKKARKNLLKDGNFDYEYNGHMLTVGATGSAKTVFLNHIIKYGFENNLFMCIMSGKIGRTDKYSMLKYTKKLAKTYGRKLYIVSMDKHLKGTFGYNPLPHCDWEEIDNILANLIPFTEPYYEDNFVMWVCDIYDAILAGGDRSKLSLPNIIKLYSYRKYKQFVDQMHNEKKISDEQYKEFLNEDIQEHYEIAKKSKARLQRVFRNRKNIFENQQKISIAQARKENAIIFFDMNGGSAQKTTKALGAIAMGELQHVFSSEPRKTQDDRKLIIMDEISYYINDMTLPMFNLSRSAGYQCFVATQSFADLRAKWLDDNFLDQMIANANQIGIMRQNSPTDADLAAKIADTTDVIELTKKVNGIHYDSAGSQKAVEQYIARPTLIRNLRTGEMVYVSKEDDEGNKYHEASTCLLHWSHNDL